MKILIELSTWLGDAIMSTPAIESISNYYHNPQITLIGSSISIEALANHPNVVKTEILNKEYLSLYITAKKLGEFDAFYSFRSSFRTNFLKFFINSNIKHQFNKNLYKNRHQVEQYNEFINDCNNTKIPAGPLILHSKKTNSISKKAVGINPGASYGSAKRWYPEEFAKVAKVLSSSYDIHIFGGSNEIDIANEIENYLIKSNVKNVKNFAGKTSINEVIDKISELDLFITGDSGPMHIAASFKIPTICIFGPTKHEESSQWMNEKSIIIKKNLGCQPCMKRTCPFGHHDCMKLIKAHEVLNACETLK